MFKVVTRFASVKAFRFRLSETVKDIAVELRKLLHLVRRHVPSQPYDAAYDVAINLAKSNLEKSMKSLFGIIENIQTGGSRSNAVSTHLNPVHLLLLLFFISFILVNRSSK